MRTARGFTLLELIIVMAIMGILIGIAIGPFTSMLKKGRVADQTGALLDTIKWAQTQAIKRGEVEVVNGAMIKQRIYVGLNTDTNKYRVVEWRDANSDNAKTADEFTLLQEGTLSAVKFGSLAAVSKTACDNKGAYTGGTGNPAPNFTATSCPTGVSLLTGYVCSYFDSKGLTSSMNNAATYLTDDVSSYALSLNPAGVLTLCVWTGTSWSFVR